MVILSALFSMAYPTYEDWGKIGWSSKIVETLEIFASKIGFWPMIKCFYGLYHDILGYMELWMYSISEYMVATAM